MRDNQLLISNKNGIYCSKGDFYIDPWRPVSKAIITHAHSDHLRMGNKQYYVTKKSEKLSSHRLRNSETQYDMISYDFRESFEISGVTISFHPAGHILGSAQVLLEYKGETWVVSGDYKRAPDPTCEPFEIIKCDNFITEATFGLPIYRWEDPKMVALEINKWWENNATEGKPSVLFGYALGKTQRIIAELAKLTNSEIYIHGALNEINKIYEKEGVKLLKTNLVSEQTRGKTYGSELIVAPPSALRSTWMRRFKRAETAFASGWMRVRGQRRIGGYDKGFVMSDHADWPNLLNTIKQTNANKIFVAYGRSDLLVRYLNEEMELESENLETQISDDGE